MSMLAAKNRLAGKKDFERVKKEGKLHQKKLFGIAVLKRDDNKPSRFAFVVSAKISKEAVQRNRITRALREAVRQNITIMNPNYDVIFLTKRATNRAITDEIMREVKQSLKSLKLIK